MKFIILLLSLTCLLRHTLSENIDDKSSGNATAAGGPDSVTEEVKEESMGTHDDDTREDPVEDLYSIDNEQSSTVEDPIEDETSDDIAKLMEDVEVNLGRLGDEQMSKLQELLGLHYAKQHEERDKMLEELVSGDVDIKELVKLVVGLEERGAKINLTDGDDEE